MLGIKKREREPEYYNSVINTPVLNYREYYMSAAEKIGAFLIAFVVGVAVSYVFYGNLALDDYGNPTTTTMILNIVILGVCGLAAGIFFLPIREKALLEKRRKQLRNQFRDLLDSLVTSINAGQNITDAFSSAYEDMRTQHGEDSYIAREVSTILGGIVNNANIEDMILDLGERSGLDDISSFGTTFQTCYRKGGNIKDIMTSTHEVISSKMKIEEEITTKLSSNTNEQYIMLVMPVVIVAVIKNMGSGATNQYATPTGIVTTTVCIAIFIAAFLIGRKISQINV